MWVRNYKGTMENTDLSLYAQMKDKFKKLLVIMTNKTLYDKTHNNTKEELLWLLCELSLH